MQITRQTHLKKWLIACWLRHTMANAGAGSGSTCPLCRHHRRRSGSRRRLSLRLRLDLSRLRHQVVQSDKPYDQFLMEQLAADELPEADKNPESLAALGFLTVAIGLPIRTTPSMNASTPLAKAMLGMTVSCARCHDHKFDPIPTWTITRCMACSPASVEPKERPLLGKPPSNTDLAASTRS